MTYLVRLLQDHSPLAVADDNPVDLGIAKMLDADLTGESSIGLVVDVLGGNADLGVGQVARQGEVQCGRRDDDLGRRIELRGIEVLHDGGDAFRNTVPVQGYAIR